ncbi:LysR family transcriptional regulator [Amaricoccus solimangrovi]|uniref:LysR family transcriptional regulator n=1 Tax=Amaricoccus solimangrovi TaxID=2589815 RepID=A0A501WLX4_9RHOB|nr:LysR family transcriptional regulator [Amaricoccus solimangrovi]TPE50783.1 LysR family transcriptional regulator [Amaricoccus solimangrovi]
MDIRQLRYLIALAREKHFTRAAEASHVTQPTLSGRIRQLEEELGVPIVLRGQRYHGLTPEGERVLSWAKKIVEDFDGMRRDLSMLSDEPEGRVTLGVIPSAMPCLPALTQATRLRHPRVGFEILSRTSRQIARELEDFTIDAGITYLDSEPLGIGATRPLYTEHYRLFVTADSPLARRAEVTWAEASALPLCALTPDMQNRRILDDAFAEAGQAPRPMVESNSTVALCAHVAHGGYAAILPEHFLAVLGGGAGRIRAIPLVAPVVSRTIGLVALERDPPPPLLAALLDAAKSFGTFAGFALDPPRIR